MRAFYQHLEQSLLECGEVVLATAIQQQSCCFGAPPAGNGSLDGRCQVSQALYIKGQLFPQQEALRSFWEQRFLALDVSSLPQLVLIHNYMVVFERIRTRPRLVICGGGHIAQPLAQLGSMLDFGVTVIDDRAEFVNEARFPTADVRIQCPFANALDTLAFDEHMYFVIITRGHQYDRLCLETILRHPFAYVGMIGSRQKVALVMEQLQQTGFSAELLAQVHAPIGLRIGAQTPAELAVCIAAELVQVRSQRPCASFPAGAFEQLQQDEPLAMATILSKDGSAPRGCGARMLLNREGKLCGSIGGGPAEARAIQAADILLQGEKNAACLLECEMNNTDAQQAGMTCGGKLLVLVQALSE